jgi:hypothetical protein
VLDAVVLTTYAPPALAASLHERARRDGHTDEQELRIAVTEHLAPRVDRASGEWPADVMTTDW